MAEEDKNIQNLIPNPDKKEEPTASAPEKKPEGKTFTESEVEQIIKDRLAREQAKRQKELDSAREKAEADALAKQGDWQKQAELTSKQLAELQSQLKTRELADKRRTIGTKLGLPEALALRLTGESDEDIEADAKKILEALPKPAPQPKPSPGPVNPGLGAAQGETLTQASARIHGVGRNALDQDLLKQKGGGVVWPTPKQES